MKKLFVVTEILTDWTDGMAVVCAYDESDVVDILQDRFNSTFDVVDGPVRFIGYADELVDVGVVEFVFGGG